jgi:hypothetical protein
VERLVEGRGVPTGDPQRPLSPRGERGRTPLRGKAQNFGGYLARGGMARKRLPSTRLRTGSLCCLRPRSFCRWSCMACQLS